MKIREKILNGIELSREEIKHLYYIDFNENHLYKVYQKSTSFDTTKVIIQDDITKKYFQILLFWSDYRELEFYSQIAIEVEPREKTIIEYVPIEKGE